MTERTLALPAALRRVDSEGWRVEEGAPARGEAFTDFGGCRLVVPAGDTPSAAAIRCHELMHVKVSPRNDAERGDLIIHANEVVQACEEIRVNWLTARAGHDLDDLIDGSEKLGGARVPSTKAGFESAVIFTAATSGGKAQRDFLAGIKQSNPDWLPALRQLARQLKQQTRGWWVESVASVKRDSSSDGLVGFTSTVTPLVRIVETYLNVSPTILDEPDVLRQLRRRAETEGTRRPPSGEWARLVIGETVLDTATGSIRMARKRRASNYGTRVGNPSRLLTDPQRRVMTSRARTGGGVVVVDLSGSMCVKVEDIDALLRAARGVTILGYSHRPGDDGATPNAWILARDGMRVSEGVASNVGNGVDMPALQWAQGMRRGGAPLVWICDGQTTDSHDHPFGAVEVARFVRDNRVYSAGNIEEAIALFERGANLNVMRLPRGRVGRAGGRPY